MTIPSWGELLAPLLKLTHERGNVRISVAYTQIADLISLSAEERKATSANDVRPLYYRAFRRARRRLLETGFIASPERGLIAITDAGRAFLATGQGMEPEQLGMALRASLRLSGNDDVDDEPEESVAGAGLEAERSPEEVFQRAERKARLDLASDLIGRLTTVTPGRFERIVVDLLLAMGFGGGLPDAGRAIGGSGDGGIDGVIDQDALGLDRVYIQAKRYKADNSVGPMAIQAFFGALNMAKAAKGVFITTSTFTKAATQTAEQLSSRIVLIDGDRLAALMIRYDVGVRIEQTFHIKKIDEDFFLDE